MIKPYGTDRSKKEEVRQMFDRIAPAYDRLNHVLSFNLDRVWRRKTVSMVAAARPGAVLDMATGTGDLAIKMARRMPAARVTGVDLCPEMIRYARMKVERKGLGGRIDMAVGDGEALDIPDGVFDCATIAFGIRNYQDIPAGLREFARVLKPGGEVHILEFSTPRGRVFGPLYRFYFHRILPVIGGLVSKDRDAYAYLPGSVDGFPERESFVAMMEAAGFAECRVRLLMRGVACIYSAKKEPAHI